MLKLETTFHLPNADTSQNIVNNLGTLMKQLLVDEDFIGIDIHLHEESITQSLFELYDACGVSGLTQKDMLVLKNIADYFAAVVKSPLLNSAINLIYMSALIANRFDMHEEEFAVALVGVFNYIHHSIIDREVYGYFFDVLNELSRLHFELEDCGAKESIANFIKPIMPMLSDDYGYYLVHYPYLYTLYRTILPITLKQGFES